MEKPLGTCSTAFFANNFAIIYRNLLNVSLTAHLIYKSDSIHTSDS